MRGRLLCERRKRESRLFMAIFNNPRKTAATATGSATLARGTHTPVDATSGAKTMTLPTNAPAGVEISVEKVDSSTNAVTVSGTLRGASSSIALTSQYDARTFLSEGNGSWRPTSDHRTKASLDAAYGTGGSLQSTDANIFYSTSASAYPLRSTVTTDSTRRARWIGPTSPIIGGGYAINGLDIWEQTA